MADNNDFTHEFQIYTTDLNAGTMGTGKFLLFDNNINALKVESIDNIKIGGGANGRLLATDGEGNLRWISAAAGTGGVSSYNELEDLPTLFSGSYNDLTNKPTIPGEVSLGNFIFSLGDASLPAGGTMTLSTYRSGANEESRLTLSPTTESSLYAAGVLKLGTGYGSGSEQYWQFGANGVLTIPGSGDIVQNGVSVLGGGPTNEITNTNGDGATYSVSVGTDGVVTMTTARGGIEFGALPEVGGTTHLHIMRPAGQNSSTDLYFGDDYNYVKLPGLYGIDPNAQQGVEIGSSLNEGTVSVWKFGTDGHLTLPAGGDIKDSTGTSVLGGGSASTGNITFSGDNISGSENVVRIRSLNTTTTASYSFTPGVDYSTAVWDADAITFNDPTQAIYDAIWALTNLSTIQVQVGSTWFTVTSTGSSTPGMPQAPTLFINQTAVGGPLNIDVVDIDIIQGTESYVEIDGSDFRVDVQDDIRIYGNDTFLLYNKSTTDPIRIETNDGSHQWSFDSEGHLILPNNGDIKNDNGNSLLFSGSYNDLSDTPASFDGDYNSLTNKPTIRIAVPTGSGPGGNLQADSLALAGLNPVTDIPSTWGGDLILQGGVGGANGDLYG